MREFKAQSEVLLKGVALANEDANIIRVVTQREP
jgi:hypothetical protein